MGAWPTRHVVPFIGSCQRPLQDTPQCTQVYLTCGSTGWPAIAPEAERVATKCETQCGHCTVTGTSPVGSSGPIAKENSECSGLLFGWQPWTCCKVTRHFSGGTGGAIETTCRLGDPRIVEYSLSDHSPKVVGHAVYCATHAVMSLCPTPYHTEWRTKTRNGRQSVL